MKNRLDILMVEKGMVESRAKAQALIMAKQVSVGNKTVDKPGTKVDVETIVTIEELFPYVSRGALKLEKAYQEFGLDFKNKIVLDIGSSTGGFTDFALKCGAKKVFAVDVGKGQLDQKLRNDKKVVVMEQTDFRKLGKLDEEIDYFLCDVSFISLRQIIPHILTLIAKSQQRSARVIALIKPQFEAGVKEVTRGKGVIKNEQTRQEIVASIKEFVQGIGFEVIGLIDSPIRGAKGNKEYLIYLKK